MDLVTDFKQIIKDKINDTFEFLNTIYKNLDQNDSDNKDIIREINKSYILISIWRNNFSDDKNIALIDNILLNYCSLTHAILLKDNKVINFLLRNSIESFLRYVNNEPDTRDLEALFSDLKDRVAISEGKNLISNYSSQLKNIYTNSNFYIHTYIDKIPDIKTLADYLHNDDFNYISVKKTLEKMNKAMICILRIIYIDVFLSLKPNAQAAHYEFIHLDENIKFDDYKKKYISYTQQLIK